MDLPTANNEQVKTYQPPVKAASITAVLRRMARSRLAGPMLLLVICFGFCWKLVLSNEYTWIDDPDITNMDVPRLQFQRATWRQSRVSAVGSALVVRPAVSRADRGRCLSVQLALLSPEAKFEKSDLFQAVESVLLCSALSGRAVCVLVVP
jgi:hypothetical protein